MSGTGGSVGGGIGGWGGKIFLKFVISRCGSSKLAMLFWSRSSCSRGSGFGFAGLLSFGVRSSQSDSSLPL